MSDEPPHRVVLVSGLSGAGKASILRVLEDLNYQAVDNPPLAMIDALARRAMQPGAPPVAIGIDARSAGFDGQALLFSLDALRREPALKPCLVFAWADEAVLLRRFTETRRRHPLAADGGQVRDGIAAEQAIIAPLWDAADLTLDTSDLPLPELRRKIEEQFAPTAGVRGLVPHLISFAFPAGLPREADMVFDARFLANPHYIPCLRPQTGLDPDVAAFVEADADFAAFFDRLTGLLGLVLPRFVAEGKKYATIAVGCTGGRHRSVRIVEKLAVCLSQSRWRVSVSHRELVREGRFSSIGVDRLEGAMKS